MKKITVSKDEEIADVIDAIAAEADDDIALVVPKGSVLGRSVKNFTLLKREGENAGKSIAIESVDDTILAFAKQSGLEGSHPLWGGVRGTGGVSDIIPASTTDKEEKTEEKPALKRRGKKKAEPVKLTVPGGNDEGENEEAGKPATQEEEAAEESGAFEQEEDRFFKKRSLPEIEAERRGSGDENNEDAEGAPRGSRRLLWWGGGVIVALLVIAGIVTISFSHASVVIDFQKTPWSYQANFVADKSISKINSVTNAIPAQIFTNSKNTTQSYPASGSANVSLKAQGTITVYNAYSSAAQELVATTRFVTPGGKLFRLVSTITVPGAQVTNGQIVPSSIDAPVVADQPGPAYNVGAVDKLTIPGFQGSPKYNAFYGQLKSGTSGGFTGTKAVPTAADITSAKAKMTALLQSSLASNLTTSYPNNFKILNGATNVVVAKLTVSTSTDASGNFSVFGEATLQTIGFDEDGPTGLKAYLLSLAQTQEANSVFSSSSLSVNYGSVQANFTKGTVSFSLSAQGTLEPLFDADGFKASIAGKSVNDARTAIAALPGLSDGRLSVWPMWLWSIPSNVNKIQLSAN